MITAALSLQDPRERPVEQQAQADQKHARFKDETSDFLTWLNLWRYVRTQQRELSLQRVPPDVPRGVPQLPADPRVAVARVPAAADRQAARARRIGDRRRRAGRRRHPPGAAVRAALPHRAARPREARLPRRPQHAVLDLPGLGAVPEAAAVRDVRRARRDLQAVGPRQNAAIKPEWAEELGAHLVKRTYSEPHWSKKRAVGDGLRARHPVRRPAGRRAPGVLRQGRPGDQPRAVHPARPGLRRVVDPAAVHGHATGSCSTRSWSSSTAPGAATSWSTSTRCSTSTTPGSAPRWSPARTSTPGGRGVRHDDPELLTFDPRDAGQRHRRGGHRAGLPGPVARGRPGAAADLPVRAGRCRGRGDGRRTGGDAEPGRAVAVHLAGARPAAGPGGRADPVAAQAAAGQLRAGARTSPGTSWPPRSPGEESLLDALERFLRGGDRRRRAAGGLGLGQGARAPAADVPGGRRRRRRGRRRARTSRRSRRRCGRSSPRRWPRPPRRPASTSPAQTTLDLRHDRADVHPDPRRARGARLPRDWSTRARRSGCGCFGSEAEQDAVAPAAACAGCCCWRCPHPPRPSPTGSRNADKLGLAGSPYPLGDRRCSRTASPPPSTCSSPGTVWSGTSRRSTGWRPPYAPGWRRPPGSSSTTCCGCWPRGATSTRLLSGLGGHDACCRRWPT